MNDSKLIYNPIQAINNEFDEIVTYNPSSKVTTKIIFVGIVKMYTKM